MEIFLVFLFTNTYEVSYKQKKIQRDRPLSTALNQTQTTRLRLLFVTADSNDSNEDIQCL